jgi:hypothetical protein
MNFGRWETLPKLELTALPYAQGQKLFEQCKKNQNTEFEFTNPCWYVTENKDAKKMSEFTSHGPTPTLDFKPEVTGFGGKIFSLHNGNTYQSMSGTSMASPFVAGSSALVYQSIAERQKKGTLASIPQSDLASVVKRDLILTSDVVSNSKAAVSGAGLVQVDKACDNPVDVIWDENNNGTLDASDKQATVALKTFTGQKTFNVFVINRTNHTLNYTVNVPGNVRALNLDNKQNKLQLKKNEWRKVTFTVTATEKEDSFQEGHILFKNNNEPTLNLTYMGYVGDYTDGDKIFDFGKAQTNSVYPDVPFVLTQGSYHFSPGMVRYNNDSVFDANALAFSPNVFKDTFSPNFGVLRNAKNVVASIKDSSGKTIRTLNQPLKLNKSIAINNDSSFTTFQQTNAFDWDGTDASGSIVKDGKYIYHLEAEMYMEGKNQKQNVDFPVTVDTKLPTATKVQNQRVFDINTGFLTCDIDDTESGICGATNSTTVQVNFEVAGHHLSVATNTKFFDTVQQEKDALHNGYDMTDDIKKVADSTSYVLNGVRHKTTFEDIVKGFEGIDLTVSDNAFNDATYHYDAKTDVFTLIPMSVPNFNFPDFQMDSDGLTRDTKICQYESEFQVGMNADVNYIILGVNKEIPLTYKVADDVKVTYEEYRDDKVISSKVLQHVNGKVSQTVNTGAYMPHLFDEDPSIYNNPSLIGGNTIKITFEEPGKTKLSIGHILIQKHLGDLAFFTNNPQLMGLGIRNIYENLSASHPICTTYDKDKGLYYLKGQMEIGNVDPSTVRIIGYHDSNISDNDNPKNKPIINLVTGEFTYPLPIKVGEYKRTYIYYDYLDKTAKRAEWMELCHLVN